MPFTLRPHSSDFSYEFFFKETFVDLFESKTRIEVRAVNPLQLRGGLGVEVNGLGRLVVRGSMFYRNHVLWPLVLGKAPGNLLERALISVSPVDDPFGGRALSRPVSDSISPAWIGTRGCWPSASGGGARVPRSAEAGCIGLPVRSPSPGSRRGWECRPARPWPARSLAGSCPPPSAKLHRGPTFGSRRVAQPGVPRASARLPAGWPGCSGRVLSTFRCTSGLPVGSSSSIFPSAITEVITLSTSSYGQHRRRCSCSSIQARTLNSSSVILPSEAMPPRIPRSRCISAVAALK